MSSGRGQRPAFCSWRALQTPWQASYAAWRGRGGRTTELSGSDRRPSTPAACPLGAAGAPA
eukprot:9137642-Prorocentrum_lima.AAC.1